ncbi:MAG TPA: glutathione S-transferase family protein [Rhizomicrobium sp.]|jgi:glutathione S-transferase|nr:glutathione S-transferase family protein [Rhizomicrobium sp.]
MTYVLYGDRGSGAFAVEAALVQAGADYEFHTISLKTHEQKDAAFLQINPSGKMPALKLPDGEIVTESLAILLAIADAHPQANLLPPPGERAQAYRWLAFLASEVYPMVEIADYPERFAPQDADALRARVRARIHERLEILERNIAGAWILSSGFSLVDIYAAMFSRWTDGRDAQTPRLHAIAAALGKHARLGPVMQRHFLS